MDINVDRLRELCKKYAVARLWVFGSAGTRGFDQETSDIDLLVDFGAPVGMRLAEQYFDFLEELESLYGRHVDLVERNAIRNPVFAEIAEESKRLIYAA